MRRRRSAEEVERLLEDYRASGMTRIEYCRQADMALSTLGRYLRRRRQRRQRGQRLVRVSLESAPERDRGFVLVLGNGRRIESGWKFGDAELARLIRVAEAV
jgi:transposase